MSPTVFVEVKFWLFVMCSLVAPVAIYGILLAKRAVSRSTVVVLGLAMLAIAGVDLYLMQGLIAISRLTPSLADDALFASEVTVALYLLPALLAGVGINVISHVLIRHLGEAELKYEQQNR